MRVLIALLVIAYLVGVGVALAPTIKGNWSSGPASQFVESVARELPRALSWPATAYRSIAEKPGAPEKPSAPEQRETSVRIETMTLEQKRAYVLADNKLAMNAGWDEELLAEQLKGLLEIDLDFDSFLKSTP